MVAPIAAAAVRQQRDGRLRAAPRRPIAQGETTLRLVGEQFAGRALDLRVDAGQCVRITTGAPMPAGADTVVIKEVVRIEGDRVALPRRLSAQARNVRHAGEDVQRRRRACSRAGQVLTPARVATAASLGIDQLDRVARARRSPCSPPATNSCSRACRSQPGQIHDSNRELLMGLLRADGLEPTAWPTLPDDPERIASMLRDAASSFDVVITCGARLRGREGPRARAAAMRTATCISGKCA